MPNPLHHPSRRRIIDAVRDRLGLNESAIQATTGLSRGAARHHLRTLLDAGILKRISMGRGNHYFPSAVGSQEARCLAALMYGRAGEVLRQIILDPNVPQWELLERLGMTRKVLNQNVGVLVEAGMVEMERVGRNLVYRPAELIESGGLFHGRVHAAIWDARDPTSTVDVQRHGKHGA